MKFKQGWIGTPSGEVKDITVDKQTVKWTDLFIGVGFISAGIISLTRSAFKQGSKAHEEGEIKTMIDLNIIHDEKDK